MRLRTFALITFSLLVTIACSEVLLRTLRFRNGFLKTILYSPADSVPYNGLDDLDALLATSPFHPQPYKIWFGYKLNSHGFRTPEYARVKAAGSYRILALGDSFTSDSGGVPADQLWHARIGDAIRRRTSRAVEVINLGVPGVGPRFSLRLFDLEGRLLSPDLVLFGLFVGNDLTDERAQSGLLALLDRHSLLWRFAKHAAVLVRNAPAILAEQRRETAGDNGAARSAPGGYPMPGYDYDPEVALVSEEQFLQLEHERAQIFEVAMRPEVEGWVRDVVHTMAVLDRAVRDAGGTLLVLLIPDVVQVDASVQQAVAGPGASSGDTYDFDWVQPALMHGLRDAGIRAVDVLPEFRTAPARPRLYRLRETHWSPAGNVLAAEQVAKFLAQ